jgi:hypothetical protein
MRHTVKVLRMLKSTLLLLRKAASFEKLAQNPKAWEASEVETFNAAQKPTGIPQPPKDPGSPMTRPPAVNNAQPPRERQKAAPAPQRINPADQKMLSDYVVSHGIGIPIDPKENGYIGPTTRQALDNYKQSLRNRNMFIEPGQPQKTDAQVFEDLRAGQQASRQIADQKAQIVPEKQSVLDRYNDDRLE